MIVNNEDGTVANGFKVDAEGIWYRLGTSSWTQWNPESTTV